MNQRGWGGSVATDGRYDLDAMADDALAIMDRLELGRVVIVGHSMGGKVAQVLAKRRAPTIRGLVLVAPAPPSPMPVPEAARQAMLESYMSAYRLDDALANLAGPTLDDEDREQVRRDTLRGEPGAKREWPERGMVLDLGIEAGDVEVPVTLLVGSLDKVEDPARARDLFGRAIPQTRFVEIPGVGHLSPL